MRTKLSWVIIVSSIITFSLIIFVAISLVNINPEAVRKSRDASASAQVMISEKEKEQIDKWILKNNLNPYGDSYDTAYTGGTPLFNETTGEKMDRYEYIVGQHPDRPWNK